MTEYYCPEHKYNPPEGSGFCFCPRCEFPEEMTQADKEASEATAEQYFLHGCLDLSEREVQKGIVKQLRKAGWEVWSFSTDSPVPKQWRDWIDVIAFKADHTLLIECKATKRGGLTSGQARFAKRLEAHQGPHLQRLTIRHPVQIEPWLVPGEGGWRS